MADPFIGEVRIFAGNFPPRGWAFCDGQLLPIAQNTAVFALIGTIYGGDGRHTTALPNLQGQAPMHPGNGPGLTPRQIGQSGGTRTEGLSLSQLGAHNHPFLSTEGDASETDPTGHYVAVVRDDHFSDESADTTMNADTLQDAGGNGVHNNLQPYLSVNFIFALEGLFPQRS